MNNCKVCDKEYDASDIERKFGLLPYGYCTPQCYTKHAQQIAISTEVPDLEDIMAAVAFENKKRVAILKRTLRRLANRDEISDVLAADMQEIEKMINELGGDGRTGAHVAITGEGFKDS